MKLLLPALLVFLLSEGEATSCPNTSAIGDTKPLYLLTLVPFPDPRNDTGWDGGLSTVPGARVAQDEINNRTDLLPDHHIELIVENVEACSHTDTIVGLGNLIKYTVNPPCRPVAAIMGLLCSSHTSILSPVAGHNGFNLMQLAAANSPLFETENDRFPHLWRFLGTGIVFADTVLAMMDKFDWHRFGVAYDVGSTFYTQIAKYIQREIRASTNKTAVFSVAVKGTAMNYFNRVITNIKREGVTILIVLLNGQQISILLERTLDEGLAYPEYTWVQIGKLQQEIFKEGRIDREKLGRSTRGHIHVVLEAEALNDTEMLVSGVTWATFKQKYKEHLKLIKKQYGRNDLACDLTYASYLYDQVWAFALALNNSLPELKNRNLSIDKYSLGQHNITALIEEEMAKLSFQGAGGIVKFNRYRGVSTAAEIYWVSDNGTEELAGLYNPLNSSHLSVNINKDDLPRDSLPRVSLFIPFPVTILLYIISGSLIIFTTIQLSLLLHYRDQKAVKATSLNLSLLMFAGYYLLCTASILTITSGSFPIPPLAFTIMINAIFVLIVNGISLILVVLCIKLLRVYRIFLLKGRVILGSYWRNVPLFLIAVFISILPNIFIALLIGLDTPKYHLYTVNIQRGSLTVTEEHIHPQTNGNFVYASLIGVYFALFLLLIVFLAIRTRKIKHENFKDTKKVNFFIAVLTVTLSLTVPIVIILFVQGNEPAANAVMAIGLLAIPTSSQLILFLPKVLPVLCEKYFPGVNIPFISSSTAHTKSTVTLGVIR